MATPCQPMSMTEKWKAIFLFGCTGKAISLPYYGPSPKNTTYLDGKSRSGDFTTMVHTLWLRYPELHFYLGHGRREFRLQRHGYRQNNRFKIAL